PPFKKDPSTLYIGEKAVFLLKKLLKHKNSKTGLLFTQTCLLFTFYPNKKTLLSQQKNPLIPTKKPLKLKSPKHFRQQKNRNLPGPGVSHKSIQIFSSAHSF